MGSPSVSRGRSQMPDIAKLHAVLFKLAKYGRVDELKRKINLLKLTPQLLRLAVNFVDKENACFVTAARNGHIDMVKFLFGHCHVDVEQRGTVTFEHDKVESVTALWAAAAAGHRNILEYLVCECGANVNAQTSTNSTPLRAAAYDGNVQIVQFLVTHGANVDAANKHGHTSLMIASYRGNLSVVRFLLDEGGADVNRKSSRGNTALHDAAESNHIDVMKALLERGALLQRDIFNLDPLMSAASLGHYELVRDLCTIIHHFPQCRHVDDAQKVDAYELLGAALIDKKRSLIRAQQVWEESLRMRQRAAAVAGRRADEQEPCSSSSLSRNARGLSLWPKNVSRTNLSDIFHTEEFSTEADLRGLPFDTELAAAQAVLVRTRLVGAYHPETCYHLRYLGATFADRGSMDNCIRVWEYVVDELSEHSEPLNAMLVSTFMSFMELFVLKDERRAEQDADDDDEEEDDDAIAAYLNDKVCMQLLRRACKEVLRGQKRLDKLKPLVEGRALIGPFARSFSTATNNSGDAPLSVSCSTSTSILSRNRPPSVYARQDSTHSSSGDFFTSASRSTSGASARFIDEQQQSRRPRTATSTSCKCDVVCNCAEQAAAGAVDADGNEVDADLAARLSGLNVARRSNAIDDSDRASISSSTYSVSSNGNVNILNGACEIHGELLELDCERGNDLFKICDSCLMTPDFLEIKAAPSTAMQHKLLYERYQKDLTSMSRLMTATIYFADMLLAHFDTTLEDAERRELVALMGPLVQRNVRGREGRTLLHHAVTRNNAILEVQMPPAFSPAVLGFLVALGAHVDAADDHCSTPLCLSSQEQPMNETTIKTLLNLGAHICLANADRLSALRFLRAKPKLLYTPDCFPSLKCLSATKACELLSLDVLHQRTESMRMPTKIRQFLFSH